MEKKKEKMPIPKISLDDLFTTQYERDTANLEKIVNINILDIDDFPDHPFKVLVNDELQQMCDSIRDNGVLVPALVRPKASGKYEMISGHRRKKASELVGLKDIPCVVRDLTDDEAVIIMVDSNLQREKILPSEKAFAYKMKLDALKHQGSRSDLTSDPMGQKLKNTREQLAEETGDSTTNIYRYIRLTELIPELLTLVDEEKIAFRPAVELSYLTEDEQYSLLDCMEYLEATPSLSQAIRMKKMSQEGKLNVDVIDDIMSQEKPNQISKVKLNAERLRGILPRGLDEKKVEDYIVKAVEHYNRYLKQKGIDSR